MTYFVRSNAESGNKGDFHLRNSVVNALNLLPCLEESFLTLERDRIRDLGTFGVALGLAIEFPVRSMRFIPSLSHLATVRLSHLSAQAPSSARPFSPMPVKNYQRTLTA